MLNSQEFAVVFVILTLSLATFSFTASNEGCNEYSTIGVSISFDDIKNIDDWKTMMPLLDEYDVKATFYIDNYDHLDEDEIDFLFELQSEGHEIGAHGMSHQDYGIHLENGGTDMTYWLEEVEPGVRLMESDGFVVTSFDYPRGVKSPSIDNLLLENFTALRGVNGYFEQTEPWLAECSDRAVYNAQTLAKDSDNYWMIKYNMRSISDDHQAMLFYGHGIGEGEKDVTLETLEDIFMHAQKHELDWITISEI